MKTYSREELDQLVLEGKTGDYHIVVHSSDLIKMAHAIAYNAQNGSAAGIPALNDQWKKAVDKHFVKVFGSYLKQEKIHIIKSKEEDA